MWLKWFPWRFIVSRLARSQGFIDPIALVARLHRFAQPSEVMEPIELLRAGVMFHARGLINTRSIQHNLHWVWPYWIERQFDPHDRAFVPRAFSITHVNLTHRNWTALGQPDMEWLPIVDPRGLLTPLYDKWSLDTWVIPEQGPPLLPSRARSAEQRLLTEADALAVQTRVRERNCSLQARAEVVWENDRPVCRLELEAAAEGPARLAVSVRPANPEGVSFVHRIRRIADGTGLEVDEDGRVHFNRTPAQVCMSYYRRGDVLQRLGAASQADSVHCEVGLATAAALFPIPAGRPGRLEVKVPLPHPAQRPAAGRAPLRSTWRQALSGACRLDVPDAPMKRLFDAAVRTLVLHSPALVYPGPYTYRRFWFRDAAFILDALLALNLPERVRRTLEHFPEKQASRGYFHSQEGEWDSNGEALWIIERYRRCSGAALAPALVAAVERGARWIVHKRLKEGDGTAHAGLLPAGFSAEHLGPNDFYYWDDFWSAAGLRAAAATLRTRGGTQEARRFEAEADRLLAAVDRSIAARAEARVHRGVPASPYREMDSGAIGSLACTYPLRLWPPREPRLLDTIEFLLANCMVEGGFFQDMIHSGVNPYLSLHLAQALLRAGDARYLPLLRRVAELASPTGQWPEAIHPHTGGGCMGDGQHVWAAAEWILMLRNLFVREEAGRLVIGSGIPRAWLQQAPLRFGPTLTEWGPVEVEIRAEPDAVAVAWRGQWRQAPPPVELAVPGAQMRRVPGNAAAQRLAWTGAGTEAISETP